MQRAVTAILEFGLGFLALSAFAALAFSGGAPGDERFVHAFKVAGVLASAELAVLLWRRAPANRLILGANFWLFAGGLAAFTEQWWLLRTYQRLGESGVFISILTVGLATTAFSPAGFVAARGVRTHVLLASGVLMAAVVAALLASVHFRGTVLWAAVVPIIALSVLNRSLKSRVANEVS